MRMKLKTGPRLPIAGIHYDSSGPVGMSDEGAVLAIYTDSLYTPIIIIGEIKTLVDPVIRQTFRIIQIYKTHRKTNIFLLASYSLI